jgi:hypothetical protein
LTSDACQARVSARLAASSKKNKKKKKKKKNIKKKKNKQKKNNSKKKKKPNFPLAAPTVNIYQHPNTKHNMTRVL